MRAIILLLLTATLGFGQSAAVTYKSGGSIDFSGLSSTNGFRVPVAAGAVPTVNGGFSYDSTANGFVGGINGVTNYFPIATKLLTFTGATAARSIALPVDAAFTIARQDAAQTFTGVQTFSTPIAAASIVANVRVRSLGATFNNTQGTALTAGATTYFTVPFSCTIAAWNVMVSPADTATLDIWKIATGTAIPTVANTIVASAAPAISTGTAIHSTTLTGWTTSVAANDIVGINLKTVGGTATTATLNVECDQ